MKRVLKDGSIPIRTKMAAIPTAMGMDIPIRTRTAPAIVGARLAAVRDEAEEAAANGAGPIADISFIALQHGV